MSKAKVIGCSSCGAPINHKDSYCNYCGSPIVSILCGSCGTDNSPSFKNCTNCGLDLFAPETVSLAGPCPRCKNNLVTRQQNFLTADYCDHCQGLFVNNENWQVFVQRQRNTSNRPKQFTLTPDPSGYIRCPICGEIMNRNNFSLRGGKKSGVLVDSCRDHGLWFDQGELEKVSEFVRSGGLLS